MPLVPHRFLFRFALPCLYWKNMPRTDDDRLLELPAEYRLHNFEAMDAKKNYAQVSLAWNELGIGLQVEIRGKDRPPIGDIDKPRSSDGCTLWIDTRDARTNHRATRYCHQFHILSAGAGSDGEDPAFVQTKIHRALEDSPQATASQVLVRRSNLRDGYVLEAFLPASALYGFDPDQHPRLGIYYNVRDDEFGDQTLTVGSDFPYWEDPTLWSVLELRRE